MTYSQLFPVVHASQKARICLCLNKEQLLIHTSYHVCPFLHLFCPPWEYIWAFMKKTNKNKIDCSVPRSSSESSLMGHLDCNANEADQKLGCHLSNSLHMFVCTVCSKNGVKQCNKRLKSIFLKYFLQFLRYPPPSILHGQWEGLP